MEIGDVCIYRYIIYIEGTWDLTLVARALNYIKRVKFSPSRWLSSVGSGNSH